MLRVADELTFSIIADILALAECKPEHLMSWVSPSAPAD